MIFHSRCSSCGALNGEATALAACRRCRKTGTLTPLDHIPDAVLRYPGLAKTERGYEVEVHQA